MVHYLDFSDNPQVDNSQYILELVPGILQLLEINEIMDDPVMDNMLSMLDIEKLVQDAEKNTSDYQSSIDKNYEWFPAPTEANVLQDFAKKKFTPSTKKKALWAGCIFEQWKCIHNYKLK